MDRGDETRIEFRVVRRGFTRTTGEIIRRWTFLRQFRVRSGIEVFWLEDWFRDFEDLTEGLLKLEINKEKSSPRMRRSCQRGKITSNQKHTEKKEIDVSSNRIGILYSILRATGFGAYLEQCSHSFDRTSISIEIGKARQARRRDNIEQRGVVGFLLLPERYFLTRGILEEEEENASPRETFFTH